MQIKSPILIIFGFSFILSSCSQNTIEEEKFEIIFEEYPKLVTVPDRPKAPSQAEIESIQKRLINETQQSYEASKAASQP